MKRTTTFIDHHPIEITLGPCGACIWMARNLLVRRFPHGGGARLKGGVCALLFALATIAWPGATLATLILFFGSFAIADGVLALIALFDPAGASRRWALILHGLVSILAGVLALVQPWSTARAFVYLIAAWAILVNRRSA